MYPDSARGRRPRKTLQCSESGEFVGAAREAHSKGWCPVPVGKPVADKLPGKAPWLKNITGYTGIDSAPEEFGRWPAVVKRLNAKYHDGKGVLNLATRMPVGVIGLDVDNYTAPDGGVKRGLDTLAELEIRLGVLPPTMRVTARDFDNGSGIRFYRVPDDWVGSSELKRADGSHGDIELIQRHHRVAVLPPSLHHTGKPYVVFDERTGKPCELWSVEDLPELPA